MKLFDSISQSIRARRNVRNAIRSQARLTLGSEQAVFFFAKWYAVHHRDFISSHLKHRVPYIYLTTCRDNLHRRCGQTKFTKQARPDITPPKPSLGNTCTMQGYVTSKQNMSL